MLCRKSLLRWVLLLFVFGEGRSFLSPSRNVVVGRVSESVFVEPLDGMRCRTRDRTIHCGLKHGKNAGGDKVKSGFFKTPGTIIMLPFLVIVGLDLLLNIFFLVKRTFEYLVLGQVPSSETWW